MNDSWHIPRPSLSGSSSSSGSSNSSNKTYSNPSTVTRNTNHIRQVGKTNYGYISHKKASRKVFNVDNNTTNYLNHTQNVSQHQKNLYKLENEIKPDNKRGSRSSQGSTDSSCSLNSNTSGSLLLTAANLERFVTVHNSSHQNYNQNIIFNNNYQIKEILNENDDHIISIDPNYKKTKDIDTVSVASSTHFTVVNGIGGPQRKNKEGICSRSRQITVLIMTMSMIFLIGILAAVYLFEMRARSMPY